MAKRTGKWSDRAVNLQEIANGHEDRKSASLRAWKEQDAAARVLEPARRVGPRNRTLKHRYGINLTDYAVLLKQQQGKCAICDVSFEVKAVYVDHCHRTGRVRGLLCPRCNSLVGALETATEVLVRAISYVRHHSVATSSGQTVRETEAPDFDGPKEAGWPIDPSSR